MVLSSTTSKLGWPRKICLKILFVRRKKTQRAHHAHASWLGVWFACSLRSAFSELTRSARLDPSACSLNAGGARLPTNSPLIISQVSRFCRPRENSQQKTRESAHPSLVAPRKALCTESLVFAVSSLLRAPRRLSRPRENSHQKRETQCTVTVCSRTTTGSPT